MNSKRLTITKPKGGHFLFICSEAAARAACHRTREEEDHYSILAALLGVASCRLVLAEIQRRVGSWAHMLNLLLDGVNESNVHTSYLDGSDRWSRQSGGCGQQGG